MKNARVFLICILVLLGVQPALLSAAPQTAQRAGWTIMVYMAADNNLEMFALADINEMELIGGSDQVNVVVQIDRADEYDRTNDDWTDTRRYAITSDTNILNVGSTVVGTPGETNTGDPLNLSNFVSWAAVNYPAEHYALILWDHGGSWLGIASDKGANDFLTMPELGEALQSTLDYTGIGQLDLIGFDACLMGAFEVYQTIAPYARYSIASPDLIPGPGWNYYDMLRALVDNPAMDTLTFGQTIIDSFMTYYTDVKTNYEAFNLGMVDLTGTAAVTGAMRTIPQAVLSDPVGALAAISRARQQTPVYGAFDDPQYGELWAAADMVQFMQLLANDTGADQSLRQSAQTTVEALADMVVYYRTSTEQLSGGVSIYFPRNTELFQQNNRDKRYQTDTPSGLTSWRDFLGAFFNTASGAGKVTEATITGISGTDIQYQIDEQTLSQAALLVLLHMGGGQSIIVDYALLEDISSGSQQWDGQVPYLTAGKLSVPVLVVRSTRQPNTGIVSGRVYSADGTPIPAQAAIDLRTNTISHLWGFENSGGAMMPSELSIQPGDVFHPYWRTLRANGSLASVPAPVQLPLDSLHLTWQRARPGAYDIVMQIENAGGDTGTSTLPVIVDESGAAAAVDLENTDWDGDGIANTDDNCPATPNPDQDDFDQDGTGDACDYFDDLDLDGDGIPDDEDNCPATYNPDQSDLCAVFDDGDGDGIPDDVDAYPEDPDQYAYGFAGDDWFWSDECDPEVEDCDEDYAANDCDPEIEDCSEYDDDYYDDDYYADCDPMFDDCSDEWAGDIDSGDCDPVFEDCGDYDDGDYDDTGDDGTDDGTYDDTTDDGTDDGTYDDTGDDGTDDGTGDGTTDDGTYDDTGDDGTYDDTGDDGTYDDTGDDGTYDDTGSTDDWSDDTGDD
ncbi:MAG: hypothetical protein JXQ72_02240 [Anaerolineae bacterium]|nr:hypothetical protein [Anaerolineae bacterium]